jgi:sigma-E factor negative regulatory protein RseB
MPMRSLLFCMLLVSLPLRAAGPEAAKDPWSLLEKAGQAAHQLNYKGIFVYQAGSTVHSMRISHMNLATGEFVRVMSLDGTPREVLRQGNDVVIYNSKNEKVLIDKRRLTNSFPAVLPGLTDRLKTSYRARIGGEERVGDRGGLVIHLEPRDSYRYGYRFSVDQEFGLLLKSVMLNERNDIIEQVAFNQLTLMEAEGMDWFHPNIDRRKTYEMQPEETVTPMTPQGGSWMLAELPPGYSKVEHVRRGLPGKSVPVDHMVFSDGLASVSLFIEALGKQAVPKVGQATQGATNVYAYVMDGHQIIVVGEVPQATVRKIAEAVSFKK